MTTPEANELILRLFLRLRRSRFSLGVGEYMAAREAIAGGYGETLEELKDTLKLLWCHSLGEQGQFDPIWASVQAQVSANKPRRPPFPGGKRVQFSPPEQQADPKPTAPLSQPLQQKEEQPTRSRDMGALPVQAPNLMMEEEGGTSLQAYYPISRRSMVYNWRYLRRPVADGPMDVLDIDGTVQQAGRQGFYLSPVYRRRERNAARLLLLLDQNGSMTPFHHFSRDLAETAQRESTLSPDNVQVYHFQNVPGHQVYEDVYLTQSIPLSKVLATCDDGTSVLIVSDAGAARGYRTRGRIRSTSRFLFQLKPYTNLLAWLNPMPQQRWEGSTAEIIANLVPMFQMDNEGLSNAIDVIRGQSLKPSYSAELG